MIRAATISPCGLYRYRLTRFWRVGKALPFVMLNPSTADAEVDDPTIRRCVAFAKREGASGIIVANVYAFRATNPAALADAVDPYGPLNDFHLAALAQFAVASDMPIVCAWGAHAHNVSRAMSHLSVARLTCLGVTKHGFPRHPLYVKGDQPLVSFH